MHSSLLSTVLVAVSAAGLSAQKPRVIEEVFPASSFGYVQFGGLGACSEAARELRLVQFGQQTIDRIGPEVFEKELLQDLMRMGGRELGGINRRWIERRLGMMHRRMEQAGVKPEALRALLSNPIAFGFGRPTFFAGTPMPSFALAIDTTGCEQEAGQLMGLIEDSLRQMGPAIERSEKTMHGTEVAVLHSPEHSGAVASAVVGRYMLVSNSVGYLGECLATCAGDRPSLAADEGYRVGRAKLPERLLLSGYVNAAPMGPAITPFLPYEIGDIFAALGASELNGLFFGVSTHDGGSVDVVHLAMKGPESGMLRSVLGRPASFDSAALCPDDTLLYLTASLDTGDVLDSCGRLLASLPPEVGRQLQRELFREMERELRGTGMGLDDVEKLVRLFGPEVTVAVTTPAGSAVVPEILVMLDVTDMQMAEQFVAQALDRMRHAQIRETSYKETVIRYSNAIRKEAPYSPALALHGNRLIFGSSVQMVKSVLARAEGKRKSLADQEDFARHMADAKGASMFANVRLQSAVPHLWRLGGRFVEMGLAQAEIDPEVLPTTEELEEGVSDTVVTVAVDGDGVTAQSNNMFGLGAMVAVMGLAVDELLGGEMPPSEKPKAKTYKIH